MANKMLIDAGHPEETRVVVLRGNRVEEFDFEAANKKQLRGNIYLAKVTRVEPSLQAAFVEYGGNRHGFLAFSEIHPDYYQIPVADRQALLEDEARSQREESEEEPRSGRRSRRHRRSGRNDRVAARGATPDENVSEVASEDEPHDALASDDHSEMAFAHDGEPDLPFDATPRATFDAEDADHEPSHASAPHSDDDASQSPVTAAHDEEPPAETPLAQVADPAIEAHAPNAHDEPPLPLGDLAAAFAADSVIADEHPSTTDEATTPEADAASHDATFTEARAPSDESDEHDEDEEEEHVEQVGGDAMEEMPRRTPRLRRHYKIQEVIKRRQVLLIQVVKEERGNKGAALTTYLSLAGRYSVLMPNTARGGGISRKITDADDRQRLKEIAQNLEVPEGMGVILRTAGASRSKAEVRRDFEYLLHMWESVRELTLKSTAPALVYEEGSLIKRSIRDLYNDDIDEIVVAGDEGFREARNYMRMLMPTHARNVLAYEDSQPIFTKSGVEAQLDAMFSNQVTLRSGGYIVINQTEALVAIDVNSGRSTREHNIEDTAVRTNCEAADEVARQLRLRDLAGLIVVDFIDMEENRNNRTVERRMKDALKNDRARIQVGRISHFGLLEMSRQRMRTGVLEGSTVLCPHCAGAGTVRSTSSIALHVLRVLEDALIKSAAFNLTVRTRTTVALYILNQKRGHLRALEERFGVSLTVAADDSLTGTAYHAVERGTPAEPMQPASMPNLVRFESVAADFDEEPLVEEEVEGGDEEEERGAATGGDDMPRKRRRRRRGGRGASAIDANAPQPADDALGFMAGVAGDAERPADPALEALDGDDDAGIAEIADDGGEFGDSERRRRRSRRGGRGRRRREDVLPGSAEEGSAEAFEVGTQESASAEPADDGRWAETESVVSADQPSHAAEPSHAAATPHAAELPLASDVTPSADRASATSWPPAHESSEATPAPTHTTDAAAALPPAEEAAQPPADDPSRPKRSGWWQRAKATLAGTSE